MKIALLHYHLKTGGVTTVLRQQIEALNDTCDVLLLTGELPESPFPVDTIHIPGLGYSDVLKRPEELHAIADSIIRAIFKRWEGGCDILHVHNPLLAKNINFLTILKFILERQIRLFLQIHDFAEDGRPLSYFPGQYPIDCHYGVINSRDYNALLKAGLKREGLHKMPNMVRSFETREKISLENRVLYPIRALRRKNIGEALLLSLFFKKKEILSITLPPNSRTDLKSYRGWKRYAVENDLSIEFDAGLRNDFDRLVRSSKFLITTSITEGFGFSFLEPWAANKILWGRKLIDICHDFEADGIQLDHMYTRLFVPVEWIGEKPLCEKWKASALKTCSLFGHKIDQDRIENAFAGMTSDGKVDFGMLDEAFQKQAISRVLSGKKNADKLISINPYLENFGEKPGNDTLIQRNKRAILNNYSKTSYAKTLIRIYKNVSENTVRHSIDKKALLTHFLDLEHFSLLKWGDYVE